MVEQTGRIISHSQLNIENFVHDDWPGGCICPRQLDAFDVIATHELASPVRLDSLWQENMRVMFVNDSFEYILNLTRDLEGVYIIWQAVGYCEMHHHQISRAVYIGKGMLDARLRSHYATKTFDWDFVGVTYKELPNRTAKYVEQLLLDIYCPDLNVHEVRGTRALLSCWEDDLWDTVMH